MRVNFAYLILIIFLSGCQRERRPSPSPNIIMIVTDDHAKNAVSAYGSKLINTPNIDLLAKQGIKFNNAFVTNSLCGPARAVMLTGKYSHVNGFRDNNDTFDNGQVTFPKLLRDAGYYTAIVGKWHLVTEPTGFDYWNILIDQGNYYNPDFVEMGDTVRRQGYTTDLITDLAIDRLRARPEGKPFCLLLHQKAPHRNWMPNLKHLTMFDGDTIPMPANFYDNYETRTKAANDQDMEIKNMFQAYDAKLMLKKGAKDPGTGGGKNEDGAKMWAAEYARLTDEQKMLWDGYYKPISDAFYKSDLKGKKLQEWMYQRYIKDYLACVASVDENIGRLLDWLKANDMLDNTIIVYTSDQGFFLGEHGWYDKRFMYEESIGIPLIIRYPLKVPAELVDDNMVLNLDLAPTILEVAGVDVPADMQGKSLMGLMSKTPDREWRNSIYYHYYEFPHGWHNVKKHYGVRTQRYKLIHFYNDIDDWELYDLAHDPYEMENVYSHPEMKGEVEALKKELDDLRALYYDTAKLEMKE